MKRNRMFQTMASLCAALLLCAGFTACQNDDKNIVETEPMVVKSIEYVFEEGDGVSTYEVELDTLIYTNYGSQPKPCSYNSNDRIFCETTFSSNDPEAFTWMVEGDTVLVNDAHLFGEKEVITDNSTYIPYINTTFYKHPNGVNGASTDLKPNDMLIVVDKVLYKKMVTTYLLEVEGAYTGTIQNIKGKLTKIWPINTNTTFIIRTMK